MTKINELTSQHQVLIELLQTTETDEMVAKVEAFLDQLAKAGTEVGDPRRRSQIRGLIHFWSSYIYDHTGHFSTIQLLPASLSSSENQDMSHMLNHYLEQARIMAQENRFVEALHSIEEAIIFANEDDISSIEALRDKIEELRKKRARELIIELELILNQDYTALSQDELERGQNLLAKLQTIHPEYYQLKPLTDRWRNFRKESEAHRDYLNVFREVNHLWESPTLSLSQYDRAFGLVQQKVAEYPDLPQFQELLNQARHRREDAYKKEGTLTTAAAQGSFEPLLAELTRLYREGRTELPLYDWGEREIDGTHVRRLIISGNAPALDAIDHLQMLAREYDDGKAETYIRRAQAEYLPINPQAAAGLIEGALHFKYVSPEKRKELEALKKDIIEPALEKRAQVLELVQQARVRDLKEVEKTWYWLSEAEKIDPFASEISQARTELRPSLKIHLENQLRRATEKCEQTAEFETAQEMAKHVSQVAELDEGLQEINIQAQDLINQCEIGSRLLKSLTTKAQRIRETVDANLPEAVQALIDLEKEVAGRPNRFQQLLHEARVAVQTRQSLEALWVRWLRRFQEIDLRLDEVNAIKQTLNEVDQLADEVAGIVAAGTRPEIERFQQHLAARQFLLQGQLDWENGLYHRARRAWQQALRLSADDDIALIKDLLVKAEDTEAVSLVILQAKSFQEAEEYEKALSCLEEWRTKTSPKQQEVLQLYREIGALWTTQLETEIKSITVNLELTMALDTGLIQKVEQLEILAPDKARPFRYEYFPNIYEELGDRAWKSRDYQAAELNYQTALTYARNETYLRLERKRRKARKQQVYQHIEQLVSQNSRLPEIQQELMTWLQEFPGDIETIVWLADLLLDSGDLDRAKIYLQQARRHLDEAAREENPGQIGLEALVEITEWQFRLDVYQYKLDAITDVVTSQRRIVEQLQPDNSLLEYHQAQGIKDELIERLTIKSQQMAQTLADNPLLNTFDPEIQERIRRAWQETLLWLNQQYGQSTGVADWYKTKERDLWQSLRANWRKTSPPEIGKLDFRAAPPSPAIKQRWEIGLKVHFIYEHSQEGEMVLEEITGLLAHLRQAVRRIVEDRRGPSVDLSGQELIEEAPLEEQLQWSQNLLEWNKSLQGILQDYASWTNKTATELTGGQSVGEIYREIGNFKDNLLDFSFAVRETRHRIEQAISAGRGAGRRWEDVNWKEVIRQILMGQKGEIPDHVWMTLDDGNIDVRWQSWQSTADYLLKTNLSNHPEKAPWSKLERELVGDEMWVEALEPLSNYRKQFGNHRVVDWLTRWHHEARQKRNRLVLLIIELYALVQAEIFAEALKRVAHIELLDPEDNYGFRNGSIATAIADGVATWSDLEKLLEAQLEQWMILQRLDEEIKQSQVVHWQQKRQKEVIELVRRADFTEALALCHDALYGSIGDHYLGGGLALTPLLQHIEKVLESLEQPLSYRLQKQLQMIEYHLRDTRTAVAEIRFWLEGTPSPNEPTVIYLPIEKLYIRFKNEKEALDKSLQELFSIKWWHFWKKGRKEVVQQFCFELLANLRQLVPDWPPLEKYEEVIRFHRANLNNKDLLELRNMSPVEESEIAVKQIPDKSDIKSFHEDKNLSEMSRDDFDKKADQESNQG